MSREGKGRSRWRGKKKGDWKGTGRKNRGD